MTRLSQTEKRTVDSTNSLESDEDYTKVAGDRTNYCALFGAWLL